MAALVPNTTSPTFGLIVQDQIPRACILAAGRIHSPIRRTCRRPISSVWSCLGRLHLPMSRSDICVGNRRGAAPAPSVPRRRCARTPRPAPSLTMRPATLLSLDPGTVGAANRPPFLNRALSVMARIYQGTPRILPGSRSRGLGPRGGNHLLVAARQLRIGSFPPGYEGVGQLSAYLILPFSLFPRSAALIGPICVYIHRTSRKQ